MKLVATWNYEKDLVILKMGSRNQQHQLEFIRNAPSGTSLVIQWLKVHLAMQGTRVRSLVGELRFHVLWSN